LLPIGGVARLEKVPSNPFQELYVALAGPAVNIVIAVIIFAWLKLTASFEVVSNANIASVLFLERLLVVNLFMVIFNMIPALPMDGGRVLRAVLAMRTEHRRATQIAASIGQGIAIFFGIAGIFYNPFLLIIAIFVWIGASQEAGAAQMKSAVDGIPVQQAMLTEFRTLDQNDSLDRAVDMTLAGSQKDFPVVENGRIVGILTQADLMKALSEREKHPTVSSAMQNQFEAVQSLDMLEAAFDKLRACNCQTLPVTINRKLVGLLTMDNVGEYLRIHEAMAG
jgi:predicted transcriptional regulator